MAIQRISNETMLSPFQALEEARKVAYDSSQTVPLEERTVTTPKKSSLGIGGFESGFIAETADELRKLDFSSNQKPKVIENEKSDLKIVKEQEANLEAVKKGTQEVLNEVLTVNEQTFADDFNFEKVMLAYYKAMNACLKSQTTALASAMKELENELAKMSEEREKEYQKIMDRMGRQKWFDTLTLGGIVAGGVIAATAASGGTASVAAVAGAAALGLLHVDKMLDHPMKKAASSLMPETMVDINEAVLGIGATILFGLNPSAILPSMAANAVAQIGNQVTSYQNKVTDGELEGIANSSKLDTDKLEELGETARFISETLKSQIQMLRHVMKKPQIFDR